MFVCEIVGGFFVFHVDLQEILHFQSRKKNRESFPFPNQKKNNHMNMKDTNCLGPKPGIEWSYFKRHIHIMKIF